MSDTPQQTSARRARAMKYGTNVVLGTVLFAVALGAVNYIAARTSKRLDLTRGKQYTVSPATRKMLTGLKDNATVTVYATTKEIPSGWRQQREELENLLLEYRSIAGRKFNVTFKDPSVDKKVEEEANKAGVRAQPMQQMDARSISVAEGFLGFTVQYRGKSEVVPALSPESSLEYQLTKAVNKVAQVDIPTIGVLAPGGDPMAMFRGGESAGNFSLLPTLFEKEGYKVKSLKAEKLSELTTDVKFLAVFEPEELSEEALFRIDQWVMGGGRLFVASGGVKFEGGRQGGMRATGKAPNINSILEPYGIRIGDDLIEDWERGGDQQVMTQRGVVRVKNPFEHTVTGLDADSPITKSLPYLGFLFPSSVVRSQSATSGTIVALASTSEFTRRQQTMFNTDPLKLKKPKADADKRGSFDLISSVKGPLASRFANVDPPALTADDGTTRAVAASEVVRRSVDGARVIVAGTHVSFYDQILQQAQTNAVFLLNVADVLTRGGDFVSLRTKQQSVAVLRDNITNAQVRWTQFLVVGGMPIAVIGFGLLWFSLGRAKRAGYRATYGPSAAVGTDD